MGSGAASLGKKFAQSEAGRAASRAAIKGAADAAANDISNRYFGSSPPPDPSPKQAPPKPRTDRTTSDPPAEKKEMNSDEEYEQTRKDTYADTRPPGKPSILNRFKPSINLRLSSSSSNTKPEATRKPRSKAVRYPAINKADWDKLPQALTLYNFRAEMKCDLEFRKGQVIQIMTRTDSQNDWWEGKIEDRVGIFPANYVRLL